VDSVAAGSAEVEVIPSAVEIPSVVVAVACKASAACREVGFQEAVFKEAVKAVAIRVETIG
jgi:hypothetical protein